MKKGRTEEAQILARYSLTSPKLRVGTGDSRSDLKRRQSFGSCQPSTAALNHPGTV